MFPSCKSNLLYSVTVISYMKRHTKLVVCLSQYSNFTRSSQNTVKLKRKLDVACEEVQCVQLYIYPFWNVQFGAMRIYASSVPFGTMTSRCSVTETNLMLHSIDTQQCHATSRIALLCVQFSKLYSYSIQNVAHNIIWQTRNTQWKNHYYGLNLHLQYRRGRSLNTEALQTIIQVIKGLLDYCLYVARGTKA